MKNTIIHPKRGKLVCVCYDNGGKTADRYTACFKARKPHGVLYYSGIGASANPFHPQGVGQHWEYIHDVRGKHNGKRIAFEALPADVQKFILQSI